ncbi:uncharacterized protein Dwil_GK19271 [Drosophila willistoni]|uniref:Uncharacterized protein n=1 Tax=Drosophila willistoni TaxID=7260 RepID=B4MLI2_DROWI|nr:uncharacterized protein LOC6639292 [Drosophila willistoni]EDW72838.1 uncharacterized protein Dwil_GK19271 [Drosophila willistoni]
MSELDVMQYLLVQRNRERELMAKKDQLKERLRKMKKQLQLFEHRDDEIPCLIASNNLYQMANVRTVREALSGHLTVVMRTFLKTHRKLLRVQRRMRHVHTAFFNNVDRQVANQ